MKVIHKKIQSLKRLDEVALISDGWFVKQTDRNLESRLVDPLNTPEHEIRRVAVAEPQKILELSG